MDSPGFSSPVSGIVIWDPPGNTSVPDEKSSPGSNLSSASTRSPGSVDRASSAGVHGTELGSGSRLGSYSPARSSIAGGLVRRRSVAFEPVVKSLDFHSASETPRLHLQPDASWRANSVLETLRHPAQISLSFEAAKMSETPPLQLQPVASCYADSDPGTPRLQLRPDASWRVASAQPSDCQNGFLPKGAAASHGDASVPGPGKPKILEVTSAARLGLAARGRELLHAAFQAEVPKHRKSGPVLRFSSLPARWVQKMQHTTSRRYFLPPEPFEFCWIVHDAERLPR